MQRGTIIKHRNSWTLIYHDVQYRDGKKKRVRVSKKRAPVSKEHKTAANVRMLADEILAPINRKQVQPESSWFLHDFIENCYFPAIKPRVRPSTYKGYETSIYKPHLKERFKNNPMRLRHQRRDSRECMPHFIL